jgi:hypothetical protein
VPVLAQPLGGKALHGCTYHWKYLLKPKKLDVQPLQKHVIHLVEKALHLLIPCGTSVLLGFSKYPENTERVDVPHGIGKCKAFSA